MNYDSSTLQRLEIAAKIVRENLRVRGTPLIDSCIREVVLSRDFGSYLKRVSGPNRVLAKALIEHIFEAGDPRYVRRLCKILRGQSGAWQGAVISFLTKTDDSYFNHRQGLPGRSDGKRDAFRVLRESCQQFLDDQICR